MTGIDGTYPASWPALDKRDSGCPNLTGQFSNRGNYTYAPLGGSSFLSFQLGIPLTERQFSAVDAVRVSPMENGVLMVEAMSSGAAVATRRLSLANGDYSCNGGAFVFSAKSETQADGFGVARKSSTLSLMRGNDGSIIGEERSSTLAAAMYVIPMGGVQTFWYRWHPN